MIKDLTEDLTKQIIDFYLFPNSARQTCIKFNISRNDLFQLLENNNIQKHSKETINQLTSKCLITKLSPEQEQEIINFYLDNHTLRETCKKFNLHQKRVTVILNNYNIKKHSKEEWLKRKMERQVEHNLEKYGVESTFRLDSVKEKIKQTCRKKYNVDSIAQLDSTKEKKKQTCKDKYGVEYVTQLDSVKEKTKQTCQEKYGVISYSQTTEYKERYKQTCKEKYGCEYASQSNEVKEKIKQTNLERYGSAGALSDPLVQTKRKQTMLERYGTENPMALEEFIEKQKQTCIKKYGVDSYTKTEEFKEKAKQTNLERYGVEIPMTLDDIKEKLKQTNLERYGVEFYSQTNEWKDKAVDKIKQTTLEHYGVEYYFQTEDCKEKSKKTLFEKYGMYHTPSFKYTYNNEYFDSFPELCFYLYHIENNISIEHEPIELIYYCQGKQYSYYPDFKVENQLIEIKGHQFLKEDGTWYCPFDQSYNEVYEAKHQCALANNVKILYNPDYKKYLDWFEEQNYKKEDFLVKKD